MNIGLKNSLFVFVYSQSEVGWQSLCAAEWRFIMMVSEEQCVMMTVQFFYYIIGFYNIFAFYLFFTLFL